jgi:hypothetical protein
MKELEKMRNSTKISSKKMMIILKNLKKVRFPLDSQKERTLEFRSLGEAEHMV